MLRDPRGPLLVGSVSLLAMAAYLAAYHPSPGPLSETHGKLAASEDLSSCESCHRDGELAGACLDCHHEIAEQVADGEGYHGAILSGQDPRCRPCHLEHVAADFPLISKLSWPSGSEQSFDHSHVTFRLGESHDLLPCEDCHAGPRAPEFQLASYPTISRSRTFLGLSQTCAVCHENVHGEEVSSDCETCHDQKKFRPAPHFEHSKFFALAKGHAGLECRQCHLPSTSGGPKVSLAYGEVPGKRCQDCHDDPHRTRWDRSCEDCHADDASPWRIAAQTFQPSSHAKTGFRLEGPHAELACESCHPREHDYAKRFPDPSSAGYRRGEASCEGCHRDVHDGQFSAPRRLCIDCHARTHFQPSTFGRAEHTIFELAGAHLRLECNDCHRNLVPALSGAADARPSVRQYRGTERDCDGCHRDVHLGQFQGRYKKCSECHGQERFRPSTFASDRHISYPLLDAHARAECHLCHGPRVIRRDGKDVGFAQQFTGIDRSCHSCHRDVHVGQFRREGVTTCERCHDSTRSWTAALFDHERDTDFSLKRAHETVKCGECHPTVRVQALRKVVQYRPLGKRCEDCHGFSSTK